MAVKSVNQFLDSSSGSSFIAKNGKLLRDAGVTIVDIAMNKCLPYVVLSEIQDTKFQMFHAIKSAEDEIQYKPIQGDFDVMNPVLAVQSVDICETFNCKQKKCEWNVAVSSSAFWDTYKTADHLALPGPDDENKYVLMSATSCYGLHNKASNHINVVGKSNLMHTSFVIVKMPRTHEEMKEVSDYITSKVFNPNYIKDFMREDMLKRSEFQSEHLDMLNDLYERVRCKEVPAAAQITNGEIGDCAMLDVQYMSGKKDSNTVKMLSLIQCHGLVSSAHFENDFNTCAKYIFGPNISYLAHITFRLGCVRNSPERLGTFICDLSQLYTDAKGNQEFFKLGKFFEKTFFLRQMQYVTMADGTVAIDPFGSEKITLGKDGWIYSPMYNMTKDEKNMIMFTTSKMDPEEVGSKRKRACELNATEFAGLSTTLKVTKVFTDELSIQKAALLEQRLIQQQKDKEYVTQCELGTVFTMDKCAVLLDDFMSVFKHVNKQFKKEEISELFGEAESIYSVVNVLLFTLLKVNTSVGNYGSVLFEKVHERVTYTVKAPKTEISRELVNATCKWYIAQVICVTAYTLLRLLPIPERNPNLECVGLIRLSYADWPILASELVPESSGDFKKLMTKFIKNDDYPVFNFTPASVIHIAAYHQLYIECNEQKDKVEEQLIALSAEELRGKAETYVKTIVTSLGIEKFRRSSELLCDEFFSHKVTYLEPIQGLFDKSS